MASWFVLVFVIACSGTPSSPPDVPPIAPIATPAAGGLPAPPPGTHPTLLISQAQFTTTGGRAVPGPARLTLLSTDGTSWFERVIEDPKSNVFHKAIAWRDGILTIGAEDARLVHWKPTADGFAPTVLWERAWGGKFDRLRDLEIGDVDNDGKEDLVVATHDKGVVAVGREQADGTWKFDEMDLTDDTFVHEIEIGDVDGDGKNEFYATPSGRNRASGESQPGGLARYDWTPGTDGAGVFSRTMVATWADSHAKEILVADVDGDGRAELYAVREAATKKGADKKVAVIDPVQILRFVPPAKAGDPWTSTIVATLDDHQCRFVIAADVDGDGKTDVVAAAWKTGLYVLRQGVQGSLASTLIDADSTGFEHATHVTDLDGDGKAEIYVAADVQHAIRRYRWNGTGFDRVEIAPIPEGRITWNIEDGTF